MDSDEEWPETHILENKESLIFSMENFIVYIDNMMKERNWKKICCFNIDSDKYKKCRIVSSGYSTYSKLVHLIYQIPSNKQGFILVKLEGKDGDYIYSKVNYNKFKIKMEVIFYYKQEGAIDRLLNEPKYWNFMGGYNMDVVREAYHPKVDIGFNIKNLDRLEYIKLIENFEEVIDYIPEGPFKSMRLYTLIPDRYEWPDIETIYWGNIGRNMCNLIEEGTSIFTGIGNKITLKQFIEQSNHRVYINQ